MDVNVLNSRTNRIENNRIEVFEIEIEPNRGSSESFQPYQGVFPVLNTDEVAMHDFMLKSVNSMSIFLSGSK